MLEKLLRLGNLLVDLRLQRIALTLSRRLALRTLRRFVHFGYGLCRCLRKRRRQTLQSLDIRRQSRRQ